MRQERWCWALESRAAEGARHRMWMFGGGDRVLVSESSPLHSCGGSSPDRELTHTPNLVYAADLQLS